MQFNIHLIPLVIFAFVQVHGMPPLPQRRIATVPPGDLTIVRANELEMRIPDDVGWWHRFWRTTTNDNYLIDVVKARAAQQVNRLADRNDRYNIVGAAAQGDLDNVNRQLEDLTNAIHTNRNQMQTTLRQEQLVNQETFRHIKVEIEAAAQDLEQRVSAQHDETECTSCVPVRPQLEVHRNFCTDDAILTQMIQVFENYCEYASRAWSTQNKNPKIPTFSNLDDTIAQLADLRINVKDTAGNLPEHQLDLDVLPDFDEYNNRIPRTNYEINTHRFVRDTRTQSATVGMTFNPQNYITQLEEIDHVPAPFTDPEERQQAVPESNLAAQIGTTVLQTAATAATTAGGAPAAANMGRAALQGAGAGFVAHFARQPTHVSAGPIIVQNAAASACRKANDVWRIMRYNSENHLRMIEDELVPAIQRLRTLEVPDQIIDDLENVCRMANDELQRQIRTATLEITTCQNRMLTAIHQHMAKKECYTASKDYIDESFRQMQQTMRPKLNAIDMSVRKPDLYLKDLQDNYRRSLNDFVNYITCQVGDENGFCQISKDPLIQATTQYYLEKLRELCTLYNRELATQKSFGQMLANMLKNMFSRGG